MAADFEETIDAQNGKLVFNFTRIYTVQESFFFVSVFGRATHHVFHIEKNEGVWKIVSAPKPADWIIEVEEELGTAIEKNLQANS
jgi:hypothetical protein